jgi:hypothetical protein
MPHRSFVSLVSCYSWQDRPPSAEGRCLQIGLSRPCILLRFLQLTLAQIARPQRMFETFIVASNASPPKTKRQRRHSSERPSLALQHGTRPCHAHFDAMAAKGLHRAVSAWPAARPTLAALPSEPWRDRERRRHASSPASSRRGRPRREHLLSSANDDAAWYASILDTAAADTPQAPPLLSPYCTKRSSSLARRKC